MIYFPILVGFYIKRSDGYQISHGNKLLILQNVCDVLALLTSENSCQKKHKKKFSYLVLITGSCVHLIFLVNHVTKTAGNKIE